MSPANVFGIATGYAPVSYWPISFPVPSDSPRSLCESKLGLVPFLILKWRIFLCFPRASFLSTNTSRISKAGAKATIKLCYEYFLTMAVSLFAIDSASVIHDNVD